MKIRTLLGAGLAALTLMVAAAPAMAASGDCRLIRGETTTDTTSDDVSACRQDVFFHAAGQRLGNLNGTGQDTIPSWNTTAPTAALSPTSGAAYAGVAEYDIFVGENDPLARPQFAGTFTGAVDTVGFKIYMRVPFEEPGPYGAELRLDIDGQPVYDNYSASASTDVAMSASGNLFVVKGVFTNIYDYMVQNEMDTSATKQHTVSFGIVAWHFPASEEVVFYDASDAASGLLFNLEPTSMAGYTKIDVNPAEA
jgi:hypothetical protein